MHSFNNKPNKSFSKQRSFSRPDNRPRIQVSSEGSNSSEHKEGNRERKPFNRDGNRPHFGNRSSFGGKKPFNREGGNRPHFGNRDRNEHRSFNRDGNRPHFGNRDDRGERKPFNRDNTNQSLENNDNKPVGERKPFNREQRPHFAGNRDRGERRLFNNRDGGNRPHFGNRDGGERRTFNRDGGNRPRFGGNRDRGERRINVQHEIDPNKDLTKLTDIIFNIIKNENNRPLPFRVLVSILIKQHKEELGYINENEAKKVVDDLVSEKKIFLIRGDNYVLENKGNENTHHFTDINDFKISGKGFISLNASGNGFISLNDKEKALYFVNKADTHSAQNGDFVEFKAKEPNTNDDHHLTNAVVVCILEHAKEMYVGEVVIGCDKKYIKLDDVKANLNIIVDSYDGLVNGTKVLLKITKYENNNAYASVLRIIGHKSDVGVDIESIVYDNGIPIDFSIAASEYAKKIAINIDEKQRSIRTDLTDKPIVTIDPTTSKDFDDAFYCEERADGNFLLAVQIADPVHYVQYQSPLDKDAVERGCSVYLVDRVIPMVPHNLSDDICSLNPNQERLTLSCDMIVNKEGEIIDIKVFPSIIKSKRRFTYDEVNEYIEKKTDFSKEDIEVKRSIDIGLKISDLLYKNKVIRGYINFEIPKAVIKVDEKGEPIEIVKEQHKLAQRLIEDFAVAANESVTNYAIKKNYPFIFRIHDKPEEKRIKIFSIEAKKMDFKITTDLKNIQPNDVSKWLIDNADNKNLPLINMFLLRSMSKAKYSTKNIGHFGLASEKYTHFTSPIRRYPDQMVHRIFWMWEFDKQNFSDQIRNQFVSELDTLCDLSSKAEMRAIKCERDVDNMKFAQYMEKHINQQFKGVVVNLSNFGCYVQLENTIEGMISLTNLGDDYFNYDEQTNEIRGKNSPIVLRFGTSVMIQVISADKMSRKIDFRLVSLL